MNTTGAKVLINHAGDLTYAAIADVQFSVEFPIAYPRRARAEIDAALDEFKAKVDAAFAIIDTREIP